MWWEPISNGIFSIKLITWLVYGINIKEKLRTDYNWIWKFNVYLQIKIFLWQLSMRVFSVR